MKRSKHLEQRIRQRGIPEDELELILAYGTPRKRPGNAMEYVLCRRDKQRIVSHLKRLLRRVSDLDGKAVLVSDDDAVITAYHLRKNS